MRSTSARYSCGTSLLWFSAAPPSAEGDVRLPRRPDGPDEAFVSPFASSPVADGGVSGDPPCGPIALCICRSSSESSPS